VHINVSTQIDRLRHEAQQRLAELERRRSVAEGLRDLLAVANSNHDLDEILTEALAQSGRLLGNAAGVIYLTDTDESDVMRARAWLGLDPSTLAPEIRVDSPTSALAIQEFSGGVEAMSLVARGRAFGAIALYYTQPRTPSPEDADLARTFAEQAAQAIETARLHAEVERRIHENERRRRVAEGMRDLLASVNSTRSLDEVLDLVLGQAAGVLGCDAGSVLLLEGADGQQALVTARASRALVAELVPARVPVGTAVTGVAVERRELVVVSDLQTALPRPGQREPMIEAAPGYLKMLRIGDPPGGSRLTDVVRYYRSILAVPLAVRDRVQGALTLFYQRPREFSREELGLAEAFADQTALAVENARLHAETMRRSRDLEALYRADEVLYRSLHLQQVLEALVDVASEVLEADMCSVLIWDQRHERLVPGATRGFKQGDIPQLAIDWLLQVPIRVNGEVFGVFGINYREPRAMSGDEERVLLALAHRAAVAIENAQLYAESERRRHELEALYRVDETLHRSLRLEDVLRSLVDVATDVMNADYVCVTIWDAQRQRATVAAERGSGVESQTRLEVQITVSGQPFGIFSVAFGAQHVASTDEHRLAQALAQRAGLAIQNARLFEQAQQVATAEERQRLARELHDAVTQTLFSASLIAEVLPRLWARNPDQGRQRLEELRHLTRGALAEMRTLLLELRPAALVETPFGHLLNQLADSISSRTTVHIEVHTEAAERPLPPDVQLSMYRIAQEALNNIVKHASANRAEVRFRRRAASMTLRITDDGRGFDTSRTPAGHLGLSIMRERARAIHARLRIDSRIGSGTRVDVRWPQPSARSTSGSKVTRH
jgi:nitrate/nitrite-specific signal transduction histidine kinase